MNIKDITPDKIGRKFRFYGIYHLKDGLVGEVISIKENEVCIQLDTIYDKWTCFKHCFYTIFCIKGFNQTVEWTISNRLLDNMIFEEINV